MTKTHLQCGHSNTSIHARGVNFKIHKIITYSLSKHANNNNNFEDNFIRENVKKRATLIGSLKDIM